MTETITTTAGGVLFGGSSSSASGGGGSARGSTTTLSFAGAAKWTKSFPSEPPASFTNADDSSRDYIPWIGLDLGTKPFRPSLSFESASSKGSAQLVKCFRIRQSGVRAEQADAVILSTFESRHWKSVEIYRDLGGDSWHQRPRMLNTMWRISFVQVRIFARNPT